MTDWEKISAADWEQLSAYLDGELSPPEAATLESRLQREAALRQALQEMRGTVETVRTLPAVDPPRDFVLTEQLAGHAGGGLPSTLRRGLGSLRLYPALQLGTALAALALVTLAGFDLLVNNTLAGVSLERQAAPQAALEADGVLPADGESQQPLMLAEGEQAGTPVPERAATGEDLQSGLEQEEAAAATGDEPEDQVGAAADEVVQPEAEELQPTAPVQETMVAAEAEQEFAAAPAEQPEAEMGPATESAEAELRAAQPLPTPAPAEPPSAAEQAGSTFARAGRLALTAAEVGLAAATLLLLFFTLRERRRA